MAPTTDQTMEQKDEIINHLDSMVYDADSFGFPTDFFDDMVANTTSAFAYNPQQMSSIATTFHSSTATPSPSTTVLPLQPPTDLLQRAIFDVPLMAKDDIVDRLCKALDPMLIYRNIIEISGIESPTREFAESIAQAVQLKLGAWVNALELGRMFSFHYRVT